MSVCHRTDVLRGRLVWADQSHTVHGRRYVGNLTITHPVMEQVRVAV